MNLFVTAGVAVPNEVSNVGPEASAGFEYLLVHPFVLRTSIDYRLGNLDSPLLPKGKAHAASFSGTVLYYRGTRRLIGYLGFGLVYSFGWITTNATVGDSILAADRISGFEITGSPGYRFIFGLRHRQRFTLELRVTELRPDLITTRVEGPNLYSEAINPIKIHDIRLSIGYMISLSDR